MSETKFMDIKEFRDLGYLQEVNRRFLHVLGLALVVKTDEKGAYSITGVMDARTDDEGIYFEPGELQLGDAMTKKNYIDQQFHIRDNERLSRLGFNVQPVNYY